LYWLVFSDDLLPAFSFLFNVMCVGATGIGKTTLIESLFNLKLDSEPCDNELKTVALRSRSMGRPLTTDIMIPITHSDWFQK